ncbi:hypothetical protein PYW07_011533 [Mythimna separata]|uniref:DUF6451 domain-containing protein n=1 Tax=Mythimna separata TaxID=271217 RepID=A0AAD7Y9L5_MYTSE|nr:hypothetical protein PYW07_011533 [Mythimna separata]
MGVPPKLVRLLQSIYRKYSCRVVHDGFIGTEAVERVQKFTYLGSVVAETGGTEEDVASRTAKARGTFAQLRPVWQSRKLTQRVKLKIFGSNVKIVLLYGCKTWKVTK